MQKLVSNAFRRVLNGPKMFAEPWLVFGSCSNGSARDREPGCRAGRFGRSSTRAGCDTGFCRGCFGCRWPGASRASYVPDSRDAGCHCRGCRTRSAGLVAPGSGKCVDGISSPAKADRGGPSDGARLASPPSATSRSRDVFAGPFPVVRAGDGSSSVGRNATQSGSHAAPSLHIPLHRQQQRAMRLLRGARRIGVAGEVVDGVHHRLIPVHGVGGPAVFIDQ